MTKVQKLLVERMRAGEALTWYGEHGPELDGHLHWPQKRTVRALLQAGVLYWLPYSNETQRAAGIRHIGLVEQREVKR